jgi:hypothetical protein
MDAPPAAALRPLTFGEVIDVGIKIAQRNYVRLVKACAIVVVPFMVLNALILVSASPSTSLIATSSGETSVDWTEVAGSGLSALVTYVATAIATAAVVYTVARAYLGDQVSDAGTSVSFALRRLHSILWIQFLIGFLGALAMIALIIPGLWLIISWTFAVSVLLIEDVKGIGALRRSFRLVRGSWWRVLGIVVIIAIFGSIVNGAASAIPTAIVGSIAGDRSAATEIARAVAGGAAVLVTLPFTAAVSVVLYLDQRVRKEGFDLELLARRIGIELPAAAAVPVAYRPPTAPTYEAGEEPPFYPPPPGWKPRSQLEREAREAEEPIGP